jgi:hypothetical protein
MPQAQGMLVKLPVGEDAALLPSLLTLSDVFCTGQYPDVPADFNVFMRNLTRPGASHRPAPTSTNCCPTSSTARSSRAWCSTAL